jgi:uncharacterized membrane protein YphA (DoxX/SURF4 family)
VSLELLLDLFLLMLRLTLGGFFVLARFRWVYDPSRAPRWFNPQRHRSLRNKLGECGFGDSKALGATVALGELGAGVALIVGLMVAPAALGLTVILVMACATNSHRKIAAQNPVDHIARVESFLWTPEPLYLLMGAILVALGPGAYSLDALLGIDPAQLWR